MFDNARVFDDAIVHGNAIIYGNARVSDHAMVSENTQVYGDAKIYGSAKVFGDAEVYGKAEICGEAEVKSMHDYIVFKKFWRSYRWFTWTQSNNMWKVGNFYGTGDKLIEKAYKVNDENGRNYETIVNSVNK